MSAIFVACTIPALDIDFPQENIYLRGLILWWERSSRREAVRRKTEYEFTLDMEDTDSPVACCHVSSDGGSTPDIVVFVQVAADASHEHVPHSVSLTVPMVHDVAKPRSVKLSAPEITR